MDEGEIRDLLERMEAAELQGFHATPAHVRIMVAAMRLLLDVRGHLGRPRADPHDDAPRKKAQPYTGLAATIGDLRRQGLEAVSVTCDGPNCWNTQRITFDELRLHEGTPVPDIGRWRGFRCGKCGSRRARVSPDWIDHRAQGNGRPGSTLT